MRASSVLALVLCAGLAGGVGADVAVAQEKLPSGIVARVYGQDISGQALADRLARSYEGTERGRGVLTVMVEDLCVALEAARRKVTVSDSEIRAYMMRWDERVKKQSGGKASLKDLYEGPTELEQVVPEEVPGLATGFGYGEADQVPAWVPTPAFPVLAPGQPVAVERT